MPEAAANEALRRNPNHPPTRELIQLIKFARNIERNQERRKTVLRYAVILSVIALGVFAGIRSGVIPWFDPKPPILSIIEVSLDEPSRNDVLDAGEEARLRIKIRNTGGTARNIQIKFDPPFISGVVMSNRILFQNWKK